LREGKKKDRIILEKKSGKKGRKGGKVPFFLPRGKRISMAMKKMRGIVAVQGEPHRCVSIDRRLERKRREKRENSLSRHLKKKDSLARPWGRKPIDAFKRSPLKEERKTRTNNTTEVR